MIKEIARLRIVLDTESKLSGSTLRENDLYTITLRPNSRFESERSNLTEVLAHELGHFVGQTLNLKEHTMAAMADSLNFPYPGEPREREAWKIAHQILPDMPNPAGPEAASIASYKEGDAQELPQAFQNLYKQMGLISE